MFAMRQALFGGASNRLKAADGGASPLSMAFQRAAAKAGSLRGMAFKTASPPMTYIAGEEMTRYCMELILAEWVNPYVDTSK